MLWSYAVSHRGTQCKYSHSLLAFSITESANVSGSKSNANFYAQELSVSIYVQDTMLYVTNMLFFLLLVSALNAHNTIDGCKRRPLPTNSPRR